MYNRQNNDSHDLNMRASASSLWYKMCTQDFLTNMAEHTVEEKNFDAL